MLKKDVTGKHCAPSEPSILQQLEEVVVKPNYHRLYPGARKLFNIFGGSYCDAAAKRLACWVSTIVIFVLLFLSYLHLFSLDIKCKLNPSNFRRPFLFMLCIYRHGFTLSLEIQCVYFCCLKKRFTFVIIRCVICFLLKCHCILLCQYF